MSAAAADLSSLSSVDARLAQYAAKWRNDPLGYLYGAFPWGRGVLEGEKPRAWQHKLCDTLGRAIRAKLDSPDQVVKLAVASGHDIGKSALMAMLSHWAISTMPDTHGIITANTETQLRTKTWAEMSKWHQLCIFRGWFKLDASSLHATGTKELTWSIDKIPWSKERPEAFAGAHNKGRRLLVLMDEASAIPYEICETAETFLTDEYTQLIFIMFGNPTRNSGYFFDAFHRNRDRWITLHIDSRDVEGTNKEQFKRWAEQYGEDSDFFRVRVKGQFPRASDMQFISVEDITGAQLRDAFCLPSDPFLIGVDVAWTGSNESVISFRKGFDARTQPWIKLRGRHTDDLRILGSRVLIEARRYQADMIFVDAEGPGSAVYYQMKDSGFPVTPCRFGRAASDSDTYGNKRAECWGRMKDWLHDGGAIPSDDYRLADDLKGPEYHYRSKTNQILLTPKDEMERLLGLPSPDSADALSTTFYDPVAPRANAGGLLRRGNVSVDDWNPLDPVPEQVQTYPFDRLHRLMPWQIRMSEDR